MGLSQSCYKDLALASAVRLRVFCFQLWVSVLWFPAGFSTVFSPRRMLILCHCTALLAPVHKPCK